MAYAGTEVPWLALPDSLAVLFDVGDVAERLADACTMSVDERSERRHTALDEVSTARQHHGARVKELEHVRRTMCALTMHNAAAFAALQSDDFAACTDRKCRLVLQSPDNFLVRQPPVWWADVRISSCVTQVQRALVYRIRCLLHARGRAAIPTAMRLAVTDVERELAKSAPTTADDLSDCFATAHVAAATKVAATWDTEPSRAQDSTGGRTQSWKRRLRSLMGRLMHLCSAIYQTR